MCSLSLPLCLDFLLVFFLIGLKGKWDGRVWVGFFSGGELYLLSSLHMQMRLEDTEEQLTLLDSPKQCLTHCSPSLDWQYWFLNFNWSSFWLTDIDYYIPKTDFFIASRNIICNMTTIQYSQQALSNGTSDTNKKFQFSNFQTINVLFTLFNVAWQYITHSAENYMTHSTETVWCSTLRDTFYWNSSTHSTKNSTWHILLKLYTIHSAETLWHSTETTWHPTEILCEILRKCYVIFTETLFHFNFKFN